MVIVKQEFHLYYELYVSEKNEINELELGSNFGLWFQDQLNNV